MWFACECVSGVHDISLTCQLTKSPAEYWELLSKAVQRNGDVFEQSLPALHVPVGFAPELGRGPSLFPNSYCPPFFFYTCFSKVAFSRALLLAYIEKNLNFFCILIDLLNSIFFETPR